MSIKKYKQLKFMLRFISVPILMPAILSVPSFLMGTTYMTYLLVGVATGSFLMLSWLLFVGVLLGWMKK